MQAIFEKAKPIRALILDVDGILTQGFLFYGPNGIDELKPFHVHDGVGIKLLQKMGIIVAIISAKESQPLLRRISDLHIKHAYHGYEDKRPAYEALKKSLQLNDNEFAYMGDDFPDLPLLKQVGFSATVPEAPGIIKQHVDYTTKKSAGAGAVREIAEIILKAQDHYESVVEFYLTK